MAELKFGALCWNQYSDWPSLLRAGVRADELGYDTLWTWDHVYPIVGDSHGPNYEGWLTLAAWAQATSRARIGLMVGANPFREPTLVAKMATTLDHISAGRAILGIGAAWFAEEHHDFGFDFGSGFPERLRWLGEALPIIRGMLDGTEPVATGPRYRADRTRNDPLPIQPHLPICVGGSGPRVTLRLVARYADMCNVGDGIDKVTQVEALLREHCEDVGRDHREIERTTGLGRVTIRDSRREAERVYRAAMERNRVAPPWPMAGVGTPEDLADQIAPFLELGYRHFIADFASDYDIESMTRLVTDVRAMAEQRAATV
jgi:alkanesulfonate monooxygenase SsuD/methylene tetrahydromethanopterin reductase-like flavin-dependent oxidoreductase (luciferase family)